MPARARVPGGAVRWGNDTVCRRTRAGEPVAERAAGRSGRAGVEPPPAGWCPCCGVVGQSPVVVRAVVTPGRDRPVVGRHRADADHPGDPLSRRYRRGSGDEGPTVAVLVTVLAVLGVVAAPDLLGLVGARAVVVRVGGGVAVLAVLVARWALRRRRNGRAALGR